MDAPAKTILVTGTHRSGTTWVGKILATAPRTAYIHEPFNVIHPCDLTSLRMRRWYQRLNCGPQQPAAQAMHDLLSFRWKYPQLEWRDLLHPRIAIRKIRKTVRRRLLAGRALQIVLKDPIALLSTDWLAQNFGVVPVIMIRHPAAFVSSLQVKGWNFDHRSLLEQPETIDEFFPEDRGEIEAYASDRRDDLIGGGALLWRLLHKVILKFRNEHPDWIYLRHEDASREPDQEFRRLFERVGLPFTSRTEAFLRQTSTARDRRYVEQSTPIHDVVRDSAENVQVWAQRLQPCDVARVRAMTGETAAAFYRDEDWQIASGTLHERERSAMIQRAA